jgi:hypothetical protein
MASELGPFRSAGKVVIHDPANGTNVRAVTGASAGTFVALSSATFAECVVSLAQVGTTGFYFADLPAGLAAAGTFQADLYHSDATDFSDARVEVYAIDFSPQTGDAYAIVNHTNYGNAAIKGAIPTAGDIATQVDTTLSGTHGSGTWEPEDADVAAEVWAYEERTTTGGHIDTVDTVATVENVETVQGDGDGDTDVDHDYGGADTYRIVDPNGSGIDGATIIAYLKSDYDAGVRSVPKDRVVTKDDGRWATTMRLQSGETYVLIVRFADNYETAVLEDELEVA